MSTNTKIKQQSTLSKLAKHSEFTIGLVVIALFLVATFGTDTFFTQYNLMNLIKQGAIVGVLEVAQTFIIITSGIDISGGAGTFKPAQSVFEYSYCQDFTIIGYELNFFYFHVRASVK